jgi:thioredoxin-like negative regulator of GroEL
MSNEVIHVSDRDFTQAVLGPDLPVLVDFWADWCSLDSVQVGLATPGLQVLA